MVVSGCAQIAALAEGHEGRGAEMITESPDLDAGNPVELGQEYRALRQRHPQINMLGGCCGTDHRHVAEIGMACRGDARAA